MMRRNVIVIIFYIFFLSYLVGASGTSSTATCTPQYALHTPDDFTSQAPEKFIVEMSVLIYGETVASSVKIQVMRNWSPLGVDRFYALLVERYYDCAIFYRNAPNFVVQFGYAADPNESATWSSAIADDKVVQSNTKGTLTFATSGQDSRSTHLFFNFGDNSFLDSQGFSPFAFVLDGYSTLTKLYNPTPGNSGGIDQGEYESGGNEWVLSNYPQVSMIQTIALSNEIPVADYSEGRSSISTKDAVTWTVISLAVVVFGVSLFVGIKKYLKSSYQSMDTSETLSLQSEDKSVTIEL